MTITLVCDPSEAMELCASQRLYLKPVAKLTISVVLPEHTGPTWAFSKWEVMDKLKNMVCPDQFTSVKVSKSTKGFIRFEGEAETKRLVCSLKEKLHGKMIKLNGFKDDLQVVATEEPPDFPASQELEPILNDGELLDEDFAEQSRAVPGCIHLEGLPCKWFALKGSDSETPSEDVLRAVFESFGKIKNVDIPMLDPYREEMMGGNVNNFTFRGLRTFEAYVQYQEPTAFAKAMETLKGMKLMFKGDDGKALACNIKVTSDTTDHFSESAINQRHLERLTLQGLERERKREENRGKKGTERMLRKPCYSGWHPQQRTEEAARTASSQPEASPAVERACAGSEASDFLNDFPCLQKCSVPSRTKRRDDDDEKKVGEGKRKSKLKRREKRQIDRDEKRPRKQQKVTAGEELWPENMPEWEERKYLLAQRRVESIRLLTVLLSQIKDFVLSSRQIGEPLLDCEHEREDCFSAPQIQNALKEKTDSHYLRSQELKDKRESKCQSAQLDNTHLSGEDEEEDDDDNDGAVDLSTSPRPLTRTVLNKSAARTITSCSTDKDCCHSLLRVTVTQDCPALKPAREDYPSLNLGYCHKVSNTGNCRKQKVYETEEFIHYLLNYYQTPRYARVCPGMQSTAPESWWQRVVIDDGNCFQVNLKNKDGPCVTEVRFASNLQEGESRDDDDDDDKWEVIEEETEPTEVVLKSQAGTRELTKTCPVQWGDYSLSKASNRVPCDESDSPFLLSISTAYDKKPHQENTGMAIVPSHKAFGRMYKLKDLLEEISSDSEYFSEASESQSKMDKRNGGCRSSCKAWPLNRQRARELLICVQNVARSDQHGEGSKRSFCSSLECCDPTKHPGQSLKTTFKRSSSKIGHEGHKTKWLSSEEERETGKKRKKKKKRSSGDPLPNNEPHFFKTNHCGELESLGKMQRKCSKMLHHKMKCKKLHATTRGVKAKDAMHLGASQFQEAHQEAGGLRLRREAEADSEGWPLFPVELVQTSPYPESICGAELRRGC